MKVTAIGDLEPRRRATVSGMVLWWWRAGRPGSTLTSNSVTVHGAVVLRFVGRTEVPGVSVGRRIVAEGTPGVHDGVLVIPNPLYEFVAG